MRALLIWSLLPFFLVASAGCHWGRAQPVAPVTKSKNIDDYSRPLPFGASALIDTDLASLPDITLSMEERARLQMAINRSLSYLAKPGADAKYPVAGVSKEQVVRSLQALVQLLRESSDEATFNRALKSRFRAMMSVGCDNRGTVLFTGYYTPIFNASLERTDTFRYPLYQRPDDLVPTAKDGIAQQRLPDGNLRPYPTRSELEAGGALHGRELLYFQDPYEAYVVEVQGSAKVLLTNGQTLEIGYSGTNGHPYHAIAQDLVNEGKIAKADLSLATVRAYFHSHPQELPGYTARNPRVVFFARTNGGPFGSLGQPVTPDVTVATDKSIFPAGAACLCATSIATTSGRGGLYSALRLDQDTGGGIRAAGRCDLYMGEGDAAERRAGNQFAEGKLYYLLLKE